MGTPSRKLTFDDAVAVWVMHWEGRFNHEIAEHFHCNQGRISEVLTGKLHKGSREAAEKMRAASGKKAQPIRAEQLSLMVDG